jgi:hypothetical protein
VSSAVAFVLAPGVLVTRMPRARAASSGMLSTPTPCLAITRRHAAAATEPAGIGVVRTMIPSAWVGQSRVRGSSGPATSARSASQSIASGAMGSMTQTSGRPVMPPGPR